MPNVVFLEFSVVLFLFLLENTVITAATAVTLPEFSRIFAISLAQESSKNSGPS
jgi:hypothetical protein